MNKLPATENCLGLRTDFSNESAWAAICAAVQDPNADFTANIDFISDPEYDGLEVKQLTSLLPEDSTHMCAFVIDRLSITNPEHPILVVDLGEEPGRTFRVIPSELWAVENNLSIGNMGFEEFSGAVDQHGIFRGFE